MKALIWNIRGFGARGRRDQLKDLVRSENVDFIGLVETIKSSFSSSDLSAIAGIDRFHWNYVASAGLSGGILLGAKKDTLDFVTFNHGIFWASMVVSLRSLNSLLEIMVVYGPADHAMSYAFLDEISIKIESCQLSLLIGGYFNLLRFPSDKSSSNFSWPLADAFNAFIRDTAIREIPRVGARFTWSNHQTPPSVLFLIGFLFVLCGILYSPVSVLEPLPVLALITPP